MHSLDGSSTANEANQQHKIPLYLFLGVLSLSLLGNVIQGWKIRALQVSGLSAAHSVEARTGQNIPTLQVTTLDGRTTVIPTSSTVTTVIYIFSPTCHWCARNRANILKLTAQSGTKYQFVGVSRTSDDLKQYLTQNPLPFPVFIDATGAVGAAMDYKGTPQTVVVSPSGTVIRNWLGVYDGAQKSAIESFFGVRLPGLLPS